MASAAPPGSSCESFPWFDDTAHGMTSWSNNTFKVHISTSILKQQVSHCRYRFSLLTDCSFWEDRQHGDFEIRCGDKRMEVHRAILRSHSEVLAKMCDNRSFKVRLLLHDSTLPYRVSNTFLGSGHWHSQPQITSLQGQSRQPW
jgi:hypothetical protein